MSAAEEATGAFWQPNPLTVAVGALVLLAEFAFVFVALQSGTVVVSRPLFVFGVPFVWINLSLLVFAFVRARPDAGRRWPAVAVAVAYFAVLAVAGGLLTVGAPGDVGYRVTLQGIPGWIPLVVLSGGLATVVVVPFKLVGYAALAFLIYVTVRDASGAVAGGILGLFSCVSCTLPILAGIVAGLAGGGTALAAATYSNSYLLSTVVFAVTVGLLVWRPTAGDVPPW